MEVSPNPIAAGVSEPGGKTVKLKVIDIGAWNMEVLSIVQIPHDLDIEKIISLDCTIIDDFKNIVVPYAYTHNHTEIEIVFRITGNLVWISRRGSGYFDSTNYNDPVMNRGFIVIQYYE